MPDLLPFWFLLGVGYGALITLAFAREELWPGESVSPRG